MKSNLLTVIFGEFCFQTLLVTLILIPMTFANPSKNYKNYKADIIESKINNFDIFFQNLNAASSLSQQLSHKASLLDNEASIKIDWRNCGSKKNIVTLSNIALDPNPFQFPGKVSFNFDISVSQNLTAPLKLQIELKKKIQILGFTSWVSIPCYNDFVGSCTIDDICDLSNSTWCPLQHDGNTASCKCPIIKGTYTFPPMSQQLPSLPLTINPALIEGTYRGTFELYKDNQKLSCFEITAAIEF